ncbi:MAG: gfo/Idh/MocA family oxidoreductase, partial [Pirellulales bacterium]|nr:gfo/Idh/MocA family oxidoreductase [Pirellulales bacterium]
TPMCVCLFVCLAARQRARPPLLGQASIEYEAAQAQLFFNGNCTCGARDTTSIVGTEGTLISTGADLRKQQVTLHREGKIETPQLSGSWFPGGFHGTMGELLSAIEAEREPENAAANNLQSLALCFAAVASAEQGRAVVPGSVTQITESTL